MLQNNNMKICREMAKKELHFHKARKVLFLGAIAFVSALYLLVFLTGSGVRGAVLYSFVLQAGTENHVTFHPLKKEQAKRILEKQEVRSVVTMEPCGTLAMDLLDKRSITMAATDEAYAKTIQAVPTIGRFPQSEDEIAMDVFSLDSLGIKRRVGETAELTFVDGEGKKNTKTFTVSGYWTSPASMRESVFWVHEKEAAKRKDGQVTAGVTFHRTSNLEQQVGILLKDPLLADASYVINLAYSDARIENADSQAKQFYTPVFFVILCGLLMVFQISRITVEADVRLYGRMRALGMTKRQIRRLLLEQGRVMLVPGLAVGTVIGLCAYLFFLPLLVNGDVALALKLMKPWPFFLTAFLTFGTVLSAAAVPAAKAQKISQAAAITYVQRGKLRTYSRKTTILGLAADTLLKDKIWMVLTQLTTGCALFLLCTTWIRYISYDEEIYMQSFSYSDYRLADGSVTNSLQNYNPASNSITEDLYKGLTQLTGVEDYGIIRTKEVDLLVDEVLYQREQAFYEGEGFDGKTRREEMSYYPDWAAAYERFSLTRRCKGVMIGADGLALTKLLWDKGHIEGAFDETLFQTGEYVVAVGVVSKEQNGSKPGEKVKISGKELTVLAAYEIPYDLIPGEDSKEAAYAIKYIMPEQLFLKLFPQTNIRAVLLNTAEDKNGKIEHFLERYQKETGSGMGIYKKSQLQRQFRSGVFVQVSVNFFIGVVLVLVGGLIYLHMLLSKIIYRSQEFAVYESLGMTQRQLKKLLLTESCLQMGMMFALLIPVIWFVTAAYMPYFYKNSNEWAFTYRFSLAPLWISVLLYVLLSVPMPLLGLTLFKKNSIAERIKQ